MRTVFLLIVACGLGVGAPLTSAQTEPHPRPAKSCLAPATWYALSGGKPRATAGAEIFDQFGRHDIVLLGEQHDEADHHQWQLQTLAALHALRPQMVIGFESFPRRAQPILDRWIAGELTARQFIEQTEWDKVWGFPAELYLPLFQFARINRIPIIALNVEKSLIASITKQGWDAVPEDKREGVSRAASPPPAYRSYLLEVFREHRSVAGRDTAKAGPDDAGFGSFVESQITWDRAMAEALARPLQTAPGTPRPLVVGIMGAGHVRNGHGVPHQLRALGVTSVGTLLPVEAQQDCSELKPGLADAVFALPQSPRDKPPPPRLGVRLEAADGVRIADVVAGSLAEATGLQRGDRILTLAGAPIERISDVISAVRAQPAGTWLPLQIRRGADTLDFVIKFPAQK